MQVNINGNETRYVLSNEGGGPWLTFIHQLGGDLSVWDQLAGYFRDDYTVLRYDVRGHGKTAVSNKPFSVPRISSGSCQLLVGPASSAFCEQMKVRLSTRATSLGSELARKELGRMSGFSGRMVPHATNWAARRDHSSSEPSHQ